MLAQLLPGIAAPGGVGIDQGLGIAEAARAARLPKLVIGLFATSRGADQTRAAAEFLARYYRTRFSRTIVLLRNGIVPILTLLAACVVLFIAIALFSPLLSLIQSISSPAPHHVRL